MFNRCAETSINVHPMIKSSVLSSFLSCMNSSRLSVVILCSPHISRAILSRDLIKYGKIGSFSPFRFRLTIRSLLPINAWQK